jgi:hypothetical protein
MRGSRQVRDWPGWSRTNGLPAPSKSTTELGV